MAKRINGKVSKFGTKGFGFIKGDDGKQYFIHQKNTPNKSRLKTGTTVSFIADKNEKGLIAAKLEFTNHKKNSSRNSVESSLNFIKKLILLLFVLQALAFYFIFK